MADNAQEFLFENARKEFKGILLKDVNGKNQDEVPIFVEFYGKYPGSEQEKKTATDQTLRDLIREEVLSKTHQEIEITRTLHVINVIVAVAKQGLCSPSVPFTLLGDVLDCSTLDTCDVIFKYVEERVAVWKSPVFYTAGKNYLLRMCNDLLRRLSQSQNTVFCGRIQLFLARLFPLSEKSALNLVSQFNLDNVTIFNTDPSNSTLDVNEEASEEKMETDEVKKEKSESGLVDYKLYLNIWSIQDIFRSPVQCYQKETWDKLTENADNIFRVFDSFKLDDIRGGNKTNQTTHKKSYFSKFLTSEKLTELQLSDGMFRRQILTQFLILFRYLTATVKFKGANLVLTEAQKTWISTTETKIYKLLQETPPNGKKFAKYTKHLLEREEFWITWKNSGCPSFMKMRSKSEDESPASKKRKIDPKKSSIAEDFISGKSLGMGSPELTKLWNLCPNNLAACRSNEREFLPSIQDYFAEPIEQEDPKNQIEDQYKLIKNSNFQWKALRLLSNRSQLFFTSQPANLQFKTVPDYLSTVIGKLAKEFPTQSTEEIKVEVSNGDLVGVGDLKTTMTVSEINNEDEGEDEDAVLDDPDDEMDDESNLLDGSQEDNDAEAGAVLDSLSTDDITMLATKIGSDWTKLAPHVNLKPKDIKEIQEDSEDIVLQARQTLVTWQDLVGSKATWTTLSQALKAAGLEQIEKES
uniref:THO complex subunit 1 isoform X1 n=1 Tax=Ciona intestinalis TaxID=7719 RepID=UPI0000521E85|nr:THO complex subunit 1 isoform X1 [Ciona intestinalis]|eukprot:XP_002123801.3 THO complex subunit 1 isoform X1 [Ciona intestinalis]